jgi:hypothetical protein
MVERRKQVIQVAVVVAIALLIVNVAFFALSNWYFSGKHPAEAANIPGVRLAFAVFTVIVGAATIVSSLAPRMVGHAIAAVMGLVSIVAAIGAFGRGMTPVLPVTLLVIGSLLPALAMFSMKTSRAAWAFLTSLCGVYGTVLLFGAPKVRGLLDIGLWTALIIPGLLAVATASLVIARSDYRDAT